MNAYDPCGPRCNQTFDLSWIYIVSFRIDVTKYGCDFLPLQSVCSGNKCERWNDDLAFHSQSTNRDFQSNVSIAHCNTMLHPNLLGYFSLKFLNKRSVVGKPPSIEHVINLAHQQFAVSNIRSADVQSLRECRTSSKNCQIIK